MRTANLAHSSAASAVATLPHAAILGTGAPDAALIADLTRHVALAERRLAEQQRRIRHLESLSLTDELTGIANRRAFMRALDAALDSATRHDESGLVAIFDLDRFKAVNDLHGHGAGDAVLCHVAGLLDGAVRPTDCVARLGGDEFAVLMTRCRPSGGRERLEALRCLLRDTPLLIGAVRIAIGASFGCAAFSGGAPRDRLLLEADRNMYRHKRQRPDWRARETPAMSNLPA